MKALHALCNDERAAKPPTRSLPEVAHTNLDDQVYARLTMMIAEGMLLPGERIIPDQLARSLGVSRTPILAALKRLSQERVTEWRSRYGVFVRRPSRRELAMIYELREFLEGLSARRAAVVITRNQVEYFRGLFLDVDWDDTPENRRHYMGQDFIFHTGLLEIADSPPLSQAMSSLSVLVSAFSGGGVIRPMRESMAEHEAIFDALLHRDPDAAEVAMRTHLNRTVRLLHREADAADGLGAGEGLGGGGERHRSLSLGTGPL